MSNKQTAIARTADLNAQRNAKGQYLPGVQGYPGGAASRARRSLNEATIKEMHRAFNEGGRTAILKTMRTQPAVFLKLLVLLVPRELEVTHSAGVKGMTDEQIEAAIETIQGMLAARDAGESAKVISGIAEPIPDTAIPPPARKPARRKLTRNATQQLPIDSDDKE